MAMRKQLKDICRGFTKNIALKDLGQHEGQFPIYGASGYIKDVDFYCCDTPYIGIVKDGSGVGRVDVYPGYSSLLGTMQYIVPNDEVDLQYLKYALIAMDLGSLYKGAAIPHIYFKEYGKFFVDLPDLETQKHISASLGTIQRAIDLKRKQLEDLDELVKSKFQEMFGDVDGYKCLRDYSSLITKGASPRWQGFTYQESGVLFITSENVREGYLDVSKAKYLDDGINKLLPRSILQKGDILINIVGASIGRAAIFDIDQLANINQAVAVVRPIENGIDIHFLIEYLNSQRAMELYDSMKQGGARDNLSLKNIADLLIPDVSVSKQKEFSVLVRKRNELKEIVIKEIADLEELMDSKMDKYFG